MKTLHVATIAILLTAPAAHADTYVDGYFKSNGTYVQPHYRSSPNNSAYDNYSSKGNTNPYTGTKGYQNRDYNEPYGHQPYSQFGSALGR